MLTPFDVIDGASVPERPGLYVLGCYDRRITLYSQQVRALNLAHALQEQGHLRENARIAVIGGGAGGVTIAGALALAGNVRVQLFERSDVLMPLQRAASRRRVDPHIYDWPNEDSGHEFAELPILDWKAGSAVQVREDLLYEFSAIRSVAESSLEIFLRQDVRSVESAAQGYQLEVETEANASNPAPPGNRVRRSVRFDLVIFAFGFGVEPTRPIANTNTESYWSEAGVPGPEIAGNARPAFFVSGNGDGGLIDLVAAASADFDHAATLRAITGHPGISEIAERLRAIDTTAREADAAGLPYDFVSAYDSQIRADVDGMGLLDEIVGRLRPGVQLAFQTSGQGLMSVKTSALNRLAAYLVIKACEREPSASFRHLAYPTVSSVDAPAGNGYLIDCGGQTLTVHKVIVRRGPDSHSVRQRFESILAGFDAHHDQWLLRLAGETLVPVLANAARTYFRDLSRRKNLPLPRYLQEQMASRVPIRIQIQRVGTQFRWTGDFALANVATIWGDQSKESHITCLATPQELGSCAFAVGRLAIHARQSTVFANVPAWRPFLAKLTIESTSAEDVQIPNLRQIGAGGAILNAETLELPFAHSQLTAAMDRWMLEEVARVLDGYLTRGADPGRVVNLRAGPELRSAMQVVWERWRAIFNAGPELLGRFFRLIVCAVDTSGSEGEAHAMVGPIKLKGLVRATAVALAIAAGWQSVIPRSAAPGNLAREFGDVTHTGHICAAEMIDSEMMAMSAARFMWRTHFVVLPMINQPPEFSTLAESTFIQTDDGVPRLTESDDRTNVIITVDGAFLRAVESGLAALVALLEQAEAVHFSRLNRGILRMSA